MRKIGLCHGVFDVVHLGHLLHFKKAKEICNHLVVSVTDDSFVNKGYNRPIFDIKERVEFLKSIKLVDEVIISSHPTAVEIINKIKPNFYFKDKEYKKDDITKNIAKEIAALKKFGGKIIYTNEKKFSSSSLINSNFAQNDNFIKNIKHIKKFIPNDLIERLKDIKLKPLIIGELIKDEFIFCETLGKSGKDNILTVKEISRSTFDGGAFAIAKNLSNFCKTVGLVSNVGFKKDEIVKQSKKLKKLQTYFFIKKNSSVIKKTKFVDMYNHSKYFGSYEINDRKLDVDEEYKFIQILKKNINKYDFILIADYDHGLITKKVYDFLIKRKKKIICTLQLNSSNIAYHDILKLNGSDLLVVNSNELLNFYKRKTNTRDIVKLSKKFIKDHKYKNLIVTLGQNGSYYFNKKTFFHFPAITNKVSGDKIGSGDTFLVLASLGFIMNLHPQVLMLLGTIASAFNLKGFGNQVSVDKGKFIKHLTHMIA